MDLSFRMHNEMNVSQQLNLAPQLLQWLRLLQASTTDLNQMIQEELVSNPALEVEPAKDTSDQLQDNDSATTASDQETADIALDDGDLNRKLEYLAEIDEDWRNETADFSGMCERVHPKAEEHHQYLLDSFTGTASLHEHLLQQLHLTDLDDTDLPLAELIIGSLDDRGYVGTPLEELSKATGRSAQDIGTVLATVQTLSPAGVGARDLRECLLLQMSDYPADFLPRVLVRDYLDALARHQTAEIAAHLELPEEDIQEAFAFITTLKPHPGETFSQSRTDYIDPDVIVFFDGDELKVELNDHYVPRLRISSSCRRLLDANGLKNADLTYVRRKIRSAMFMIQGVSQRQETLYKVAQEIVRAQHEYFSSDDGQLKPLTMAKIATHIGVHETTVSRALANKYMRTPRGLFEMKFFFRPGYRCADGSALTPEAVKDIISNLIGNELPAEPLHDLRVTELLKERGLTVARRTVAKYRDELGIPSSKQRKRKSATEPTLAIPIQPSEDYPHTSINEAVA